jgi:hypothetical protein
MINDWVWWHMSVTPVLKKQRQEDYEFEANLSQFQTLTQKKKKEKRNDKCLRRYSHPALNITQHVHVLKHHRVPHKYVQLYVSIKT